MGFFYCEIVLKVRQTNLFYTTQMILASETDTVVPKWQWH